MNFTSGIFSSKTLVSIYIINRNKITNNRMNGFERSYGAHPSERSIAFELTTTIYVLTNQNTFMCARTGAVHGNYGGLYNLP